MYSCSLPCYKSHKEGACDEQKTRNESLAKETAEEPVAKPQNAPKNARPEGLIHPLGPFPVTQVPLPESNHLRVPQGDLQQLLTHRNEVNQLLAGDAELKAKLHAISLMTPAAKAEAAMKELLTLGTEKETEILEALAAYSPKVSTE